MIRRVVEYIAADRGLAEACRLDLAGGIADETARWRAANERANAAEEALPDWLWQLADRIAERCNKAAWCEVFELQEQFRERSGHDAC